MKRCIDNSADFTKYLLVLCPIAYLSFVEAYHLDISFTMVRPRLVILSPW